MQMPAVCIINHVTPESTGRHKEGEEEVVEEEEGQRLQKGEGGGAGSRASPEVS